MTDPESISELAGQVRRFVRLWRAAFDADHWSYCGHALRDGPVIEHTLAVLEASKLHATLYLAHDLGEMAIGQSESLFKIADCLQALAVHAGLGFNDWGIFAADGEPIDPQYVKRGSVPELLDSIEVWADLLDPPAAGPVGHMTLDEFAAYLRTRPPKGRPKLAALVESFGRSTTRTYQDLIEEVWRGEDKSESTIRQAFSEINSEACDRKIPWRFECRGRCVVRIIPPESKYDGKLTQN